MPNATVKELRAKTDAAWANLTRQLHGMEPYMERADAPGEWTTREVLSHLMFVDGASPVHLLKTFASHAFPLVELVPGETAMTAARRTMTLRQLTDALDAQRRSILTYIEGLPEADLQHRKARIPLFKEFMGTDEIPIATFVGAMYDYNWNDHAGQLAKIRKAVGLPEAK